MFQHLNFETFNINLTPSFSIKIQALQAWRMRRSLRIYWRRGDAQLILAMPWEPLTLNRTKEPHPAPLLTSRKLYWSPSICAILPKRSVILFIKKISFLLFCCQNSQFFLPYIFPLRLPWRRGHPWRRWDKRLVGFWRKCLTICSWGLSGWWPTLSIRCSRDSSEASMSTWKDSTWSGLIRNQYTLISYWPVCFNSSSLEVTQPFW